MWATLIIVFREAMEAGLIVGIVLAATQGVVGRTQQVVLGIMAGLIGSCVAALFAGAIGNAFEGAGQELLNAAILSVAVVMLTWHVVWMSRHGREMARELRAVGHEVATGKRPVSALSVVVGMAVLREGSEVVLFLSGIAIGGEDHWPLLLLGGIIGLVLAAGLTMLTYAGLVRLPPRVLFSVTGWLVTFLACGLAAQAAGFLQQGGLIDGMSATLWDSSALLPSSSIPGQVLRILIGYTDQPTSLQGMAYLGTLAVIAVLSWREKAPDRRAGA